jgi:hypothetical protein
MNRYRCERSAQKESEDSFLRLYLCDRQGCHYVVGENLYGLTQCVIVTA